MPIQGGGPYIDGGQALRTQYGNRSPLQTLVMVQRAIQGWARHVLSKKRLMRKGTHGLLGALELKTACTHGVTDTEMETWDSNTGCPMSHITRPDKNKCKSS